VRGTLRPGGKQQKEVFRTLEAAESCRDSWESVRVSNQAAFRARATRLTQAELTTAEAATEMIKGTGFNLAEVVRLFLQNPMNKPTIKTTLAKAGAEFRAFLEAAVKAKTMSSAQEQNLRQTQQNFADFIGGKVLLHEINGGQVEAWLRSKTNNEREQISRKTWNNFFVNGVPRLPAAMTKDKRTRHTSIPANLTAWLRMIPRYDDRRQSPQPQL
jgi:hypothetical protein